MAIWDKLGIIGDAFEKAIGAIDRLIDNASTTKEEKLELRNVRHELMNERVKIEVDLEKAKLRHEIDIERLGVERDKLKAQIILAEAQGKSAAQRNWRPHLMYVIMAILINNLILYPYLMNLFDWGVMLELPNALYGLMTVAVGGYIGGRSYEKGGLMKTISDQLGATEYVETVKEKVRSAVRRPEPIPPRPADYDS